MRKRFFITFALLLALSLSAAVFSGCKKESVFYTVSFDTGGGSPVESKAVERGKKAEKPQDPTKDGHIFEFWGYANIEWNFESFAVLKNIKLTAVWSDEYTRGLSFELNAVDLSYTVIGYEGVDEHITIPAIYKDLPVASIGSHAFLNCKNFSGITIPDSVKSIKEEAFTNCDALTSLTFGENSLLESIGNRAFSYCSSLKRVDFDTNSRLESIGYSAFFNCALSYIFIPESVISMGSNPFSGNNLTIYAQSDTGPDEWDMFWNVVGDKVVWGVKEFVVQSDMFFIISKNEAALVKYFGNESEIIIPSNVISKGLTVDVKSIGDGLFNRQNQLTSVTMPESITKIGKDVFTFCTGLESIIIPDSVTAIGDFAFYRCDNLQSVSFGQNSLLESMGESIFEGCSNLAEIVLSSGLTSISKSAFKFCRKLESISLPGSITAIGDFAFNYCSGLKSVNFGANSSLENIGESAFASCGIINIEIPSNVISIGESAFYFCDKLESVILPEGLTSISNSLFGACDSLTAIIIPETVTAIGDNAFNSADNLTNVFIPNGVISIGQLAFAHCKSLTSIIIPESVIELKGYVFYYSNGITIYAVAEIPPEGWDDHWNYDYNNNEYPVIWGYTG